MSVFDTQTFGNWGSWGATPGFASGGGLSFGDPNGGGKSVPSWLPADSLDPCDPLSSVYDPYANCGGSVSRPSGGSGGETSSTGRTSTILGTLGLGLEKLFDDIFRPTAAQVASEQASAYRNPVYYPQGGGQYPARTSGAAADQLVNWAAKNWWILLIGGLILFYPGVQPRRRNPTRSAKRNPKRRRRSRRRR